MPLQGRDILQLDGTVIAGILILLTLAGVFDKITVPALLVNATPFAPFDQGALQKDPAYRDYAVKLLLKTTVAIALIPFVISAILVLAADSDDRKDLRKPKMYAELGLGYLAINLVFLILGSSIIG